MSFIVERQAPPLGADGTKAIRVGNSRVLLELVIRAFQDSVSPESIVQRYSTLLLSDVYTTIAYYLNHREQLAESVKQKLTTVQPDLSLIRSRLLAQQQYFTGLTHR